MAHRNLARVHLAPSFWDLDQRKVNWKLSLMCWIDTKPAQLHPEGISLACASQLHPRIRLRIARRRVRRVASIGASTSGGGLPFRHSRFASKITPPERCIVNASATSCPVV